MFTFFEMPYSQTPDSTPLTDSQVTALRQLYEKALAPKMRLGAQIVLLAH